MSQTDNLERGVIDWSFEATPDSFHERMRAIAASPDDEPDDLLLYSLDDELGGFGVRSFHSRAACDVESYLEADRDVFRPVQYCADYLVGPHRLRGRIIVHMAGLHIEKLVMRAAGMAESHLPLGALLQRSAAREAIHPSTHKLAQGYLPFLNASKHRVSIRHGQPLFTRKSAALAYVGARAVGSRILAEAKTPLVGHAGRRRNYFSAGPPTRL